MSILPKKYLSNNPPVDGCKCHCHYTPGVVHFMACCGLGGMADMVKRAKELATDEQPSAAVEGERVGKCLLADLHASLHAGEQCPECSFPLSEQRGDAGLREAAQGARNTLHAVRLGRRVDLTAAVERLDAALASIPAGEGVGK